MILEQETLDKYGYKPSELMPKSGKSIICKCDYCGDYFDATKDRLFNQQKHACRSRECKKKLLSEGKRKIQNYPEIGARFNSLIIISEVFYKTQKDRDWITRTRGFAKFKCDCGKIKEIKLTNVKNGLIKSCGCTRKNCSYKITFDGRTETKLHGVWWAMKQRCFYKDDPQYHNYGGKGIKICDEWLDFNNFMNWSSNNGYKENAGLSIDRLDPRKGYCPENCEWVTKAENSRRVTGARDKIIKLQYIEIERLKDKIKELESLLMHKNLPVS